MDKIILKNMTFYGYHGVFEEEKRSGQTFIIDAVLYADLSEAGKTDALDRTIDYGAAYHLIRKIVEDERFDLIEALAHRAAMALLSRFEKIERVALTVKKPSAPIDGAFDYMAVKIERSRDDMI